MPLDYQFLCLGKNIKKKGGRGEEIIRVGRKTNAYFQRTVSHLHLNHRNKCRNNNLFSSIYHDKSFLIDLNENKSKTQAYNCSCCTPFLLPSRLQSTGASTKAGNLDYSG